MLLYLLFEKLKMLEYLNLAGNNLNTIKNKSVLIYHGFAKTE
jgi:hypothetical protein